jgi:predicted RecA/RadA family phage recombinase
LHVVVLGGGSSGEHFVGALRRLDAGSAVTVVSEGVFLALRRLDLDL